MEHVVIVGAGHAGSQAAASLREQGFSGDITLLSADGDFPYHKPPLSKTFMSAPDAPLQALRGANYFDENRVRLWLGVSVTQIDRATQRVMLSDGSTLEYSTLILATGTVPRRLDVPGADLSGVHHLRTAADARALRAQIAAAQRAVIIGGGFIGLEAAAMLRARGLEVTVVELADRLLARAASPLIAAALRQDLEAMGVTIRTGTGVAALDGAKGHVSRVELADGGQLDCDMVLVGIGAQPSTELAKAAELQIENGIRVDTLLRSSDPAIHAIGDCCCFPDHRSEIPHRLESVQNATDQARALAATLTGTPTPYASVPWFWSDIGQTKLQIAGLPADADTVIPVRDPATDRLRAVYHLRGDTVLAVETLNSAGEHMLARKMLSSGRHPARASIAAGDLAAMKAQVMERVA